MAFLNKRSFRMRLQASFDSASINLMSLSVEFLFIPKLLPVQNVVFDLRSRRSSLSVRVFTSTPMFSVPLGAGSGACSLCGAPATVFVAPAILRT